MKHLMRRVVSYVDEELGCVGSKEETVQEVTGAPFMKHLNPCRIQRAQALLINTERQLKMEGSVLVSA